MSYRVAIQNKETGEVRIVPIAKVWDELSEHLWLDGEYACDCCRALWFEGEQPSPDKLANRECGFERFAALWAELPDGNRIALENEQGVSRHHGKPSKPAKRGFPLFDLCLLITVATGLAIWAGAAMWRHNTDGTGTTASVEQITRNLQR
jgi:hypothetical protein